MAEQFNNTRPPIKDAITSAPNAKPHHQKGVPRPSRQSAKRTRFPCPFKECPAAAINLRRHFSSCHPGVTRSEVDLYLRQKQSEGVAGKSGANWFPLLVIEI